MGFPCRWKKAHRQQEGEIKYPCRPEHHPHLTPHHSNVSRTNGRGHDIIVQGGVIVGSYPLPLGPSLLLRAGDGLGGVRGCVAVGIKNSPRCHTPCQGESPQQRYLTTGHERRNIINKLVGAYEPQLHLHVYVCMRVCVMCWG